MKQIEEKIYYRRNLPHYHPPNSIYFVTYRLAGSLPAHLLKELKEQENLLQKQILKIQNENEKTKRFNEARKKYFAKFDELLDKIVGGPKWLADTSIAQVIADAIVFRDKKEYDLITYCVMPNHVHMVISLEEYNNSLSKILKSLKSFTARKANRILKRSGEFWTHESYDHVVKNGEELKRIVFYVMHNPVKARYVAEPKEWKWSYSSDIYL
jgi:putative transposase